MDRVYSNRALVGNWYEDRLDSSSAPIPELERTGRYRTAPMKMIETGPEEYKTTNQIFHSPQHPIVSPPAPRMISRATLPLALHNRTPPADSRPHGFGSVRPRHEPGHDLRRLETTTHSVYGGKYADSVEKRGENLEDSSIALRAQPAGRVLPHAAAEGAGAGGIRTGGATDERPILDPEADPKRHTFVQRTWLGHDSFQSYALRADEYTAERAARAQREASASVPGFGGGEESAARIRAAQQGQKHYKKNDTLKRSTGIWNE